MTIHEHLLSVGPNHGGAGDIIEVLAKSHPAVCNALCGYSSDDLIPEGA